MGDMTNAERNKALIETFAKQFKAGVERMGFAGSPAVHPTDGINERRIPDAYTMSIFDQSAGIGVTAVVFGQQFFKAYVEIVASPHDGVECLSSNEAWRPTMAGKVMAFVLSKFGAILRSEIVPIQDSDMVIIQAGEKKDDGPDNRS